MMTSYAIIFLYFNMKIFLTNTDFYKYMHRVAIFTAFFILVFFIAFLGRKDAKPYNAPVKDVEATNLATAQESTPPPTPEPTATPKAVYIPDPEELQEIPDIDTIDLIQDDFTSSEKLTLSWKEQPDADYYLLCVLDEEKEIIQKEILWSNITEWEITNFYGSYAVLLCYKDMGEDGTDDDKLINSYILEVDHKEDVLLERLLDVNPEDRYYIIVDKQDFSFAVLTLDENMEYTKVLATFPCALGRTSRMTPEGEFVVSYKGQWKEWKTGEFSPYYTRFTSGLYIHGPLYTTKSPSTIIKEYYDHIGTNDTSGCIRTTTEGAMWVYYNCPSGTVVEIVPESDLVDKVEKPAMDPQHPSWDPTDPDKPRD